MDDIDLVRLALQDAGPREDRILEVVQIAESTWVVRFEQVDVVLELDPATHRLVLSTDLGQVPEAKREEIYQILLTYSLLWRDTGGLHMALDASQRALMMLDLHSSTAKPDFMAIVLRNFEERTLMWRDFFGTGGEAQREPETKSEFPMIPV